MRLIVLSLLMPVAFSGSPEIRREIRSCVVMSADRPHAVPCIVLGTFNASSANAWILTPDEGFRLRGPSGASRRFLLQHKPAEEVDTPSDGRCFLQIPLGEAVCIGRPR